MLHLFGKPKAVLAKYFNSKSLEIDTEDIADIIFILNNNIYLNMHLDFCSLSEKREIEILFNDNSKISLDLRSNLIKTKNFNKTVMKKYLLDKNYYTKNQIKKMISISNSNKNDKWMPEFLDSLHVLEIIEKIRESNFTNKLVQLNKNA